MKILFASALWLAAIVVAGLVLYRLIRKKPMLLHGRIARRAIRLAAVVMVALGIGGCEDQPESTGNAALETAETLEADEANTSDPDNPAASLSEDNRSSLSSQPSRGGLGGEQSPDTQFGRQEDEIAFLREVGQSLQNSENRTAAHGFARRVQLVHERKINNDENLEEWQSINRHRPSEINADSGLWAVISDREAQRTSETGETIEGASGYTAQDVLLALNEIATPGRLHPSLNAYLWGRLMALPAPADLEETRAVAHALWRIERNGRLLNAMVRAEHEVGLTQLFFIPPRAWTSKAGRPPLTDAQRASIASAGRIQASQARDYQRVIQDFYDAEDSGPWEDEGLVLLRLDAMSGPVQVIHPDVTEPMGQDRFSRMGRLDLIRTGPGGGCVVSDWLGRIELPADAVIRVSDLPALLNDDQRAKINAAIQSILREDILEAILEQQRQEGRGTVQPGLGGRPSGFPLERDLEAELDEMPGDMGWAESYEASRQSAETAMLLLERNMPWAYPQVRAAYLSTPQSVAEIEWASALRYGHLLYQPHTIDSGGAALGLITHLYEESIFIGADGRLKPYDYALRPIRTDSGPGEAGDLPRRPGGLGGPGRGLGGR